MMDQDQEKTLRDILRDVYWTGYYHRQNRTFNHDAKVSADFVNQYLAIKVSQWKETNIGS